jgi:cell division protein FtsI/penicillin-binding protein 2
MKHELHKLWDELFSQDSKYNVSLVVTFIAFMWGALKIGYIQGKKALKKIMEHNSLPERLSRMEEKMGKVLDNEGNLNAKLEELMSAVNMLQQRNNEKYELILKLVADNSKKDEILAQKLTEGLNEFFEDLKDEQKELYNRLNAKYDNLENKLTENSKNISKIEGKLNM